MFLPFGCAWIGEDEHAAFVDADGDGFYDEAFSDGDDCNDLDAAVHPQAQERPNGIDDDCDGDIDEGVVGGDDRDGDGFSEADGDCDDGDGAVNPDATEVWYDGVDQDCDEASDYDADADGYDSEDHSGEDCDDGDAAINPAATETWGDGIDNDCGFTGGTISLGFADAKLTGEATYDYAGYSVSGAGDVNGDGWDDLLVGADGEDFGGTVAGAAYLVLGPVSGTVDLGASDAKLSGEAGGDYAGVSVSGAGDVDGDGSDDLLVGALGAAYLVLGANL